MHANILNLGGNLIPIRKFERDVLMGASTLLVLADDGDEARLDPTTETRS